MNTYMNKPKRYHIYIHFTSNQHSKCDSFLYVSCSIHTYKKKICLLAVYSTRFLCMCPKMRLMYIYTQKFLEQVNRNAFIFAISVNYLCK